MPTNLFGLLRDYKTTSIGENLDDSASFAFSYQANALKPYAPVHVKGVRNASGDLRDGVDAPLSEDFEKYEIDILDNETVLRTLFVTENTVSYSAAQQLEDFGVLQADIDVKIYQISAAVGRGKSASAII